MEEVVVIMNNNGQSARKKEELVMASIEHEQSENVEVEIEEMADLVSAESSEIEIEPCRLCDDVGEKMFNIFEDNPEGYQLIGLIKENLPIVLYKTDPLPKRVCDKCVTNLQIISGLKKRSRKTQEKYVERLKTIGDTTDKNVLLFLGCTGSKLIDNGDVDDEEDEEELKDEATSTDDLTILCANCKTTILDASLVNGDVELAGDLNEAIRESLKRNQIPIGDIESEKVLRKRKTRPLYHELDDSLCSSETELQPGGDDASQYNDSDIESDESNEERPTKRRKIDKPFKEINSEKVAPKSEDKELETLNSDNVEPEGESNDGEAENERIQLIKKSCEKIFHLEEDFTYEPLSLLEMTLNCINAQNLADFSEQHFRRKSTICHCKTCAKEFKNVKLLALHEVEHMEVDLQLQINNPNPWLENQPFAKIRNNWLTQCDEKGAEDESILAEGDKEEEIAALLVEDKAVAVSKKDEIVLVDMKPMVNCIYLGDYTKEERKTFYQCMRIGGQTKRFCPLCKYCFKDNWAIESHYFSFACYYTCRYCGMRFNKQRHRFEEHIKEHKDKNDVFSDKIYTASKANNTLPKVIQPDKIKRIVPEKPREVKPEDCAFPPVVMKGGFDQKTVPPPQVPQAEIQPVKIKEEPKDSAPASSPSKTQNQAYFCRKCYKVFFKLDEFNAHSKNCDYNNFTPAQRGNNAPGAPAGRFHPIKIKQESNNSGKTKFVGELSNTGRPMRNCVRDIGPYKDEVYIPKQVLNETLPGPPQSFICHICGTPFPTIYSRNSHMRIHKGESPANANGAGASAGPQIAMQQNILKQRLQQQQHQNIQMQKTAVQQQQRQMIRQRQIQQRVHMQQQQNNYGQFDEIRVKEEPVDSFEPMVEIHEGPETPPSPPQNYQAAVPRELGGGAVSLTPIVKKPALNPSILKLVENNPNISLVSKKSSSSGTPPKSSNGDGHRSNIIKNAGGYQGPYAPVNQQRELNGAQNHQAGLVAVSSSGLMPNDDNKSYKCSSCWEAFSNKSHLYFHKKNQCEGSRFPCPFCKKRFGTEAAYSSHIFYSHPE